jgi:hypothetical protein
MYSPYPQMSLPTMGIAIQTTVFKDGDAYLQAGGGVQCKSTYFARRPDGGIDKTGNVVMMFMYITNILRGLRE